MGMWMGHNPSIQTNGKISAEEKRKRAALEQHKINSLKKARLKQTLDSEGLE